MDSKIEYDKMASELQTEFFSLLELARKYKTAGDEKKYRAWVDSVWKVASTLTSLKNLQRNLGQGSETDSQDEEYAKLVDRLSKEFPDLKQPLIQVKDALERKRRIRAI